jgi:hypothetical protein
MVPEVAAGKKIMPDPDMGWTVSIWVYPTRKAERSDQYLMYIDDGIAPCEIAITPSERVRITTGPDLQQTELNALKSEGGFHTRENDDYLRCRSGMSQDCLRFGDWNHIAVIQSGFTRSLVINGVLADATHHGGRPATPGQYAQALVPDENAGKGYTCRPVHAVRLGGIVGETVAFRGWVGPLTVWAKPFPSHEVMSMYWNNLVTNIFHPYFTLQPYSAELPEVDTTASVWTLPRLDDASLMNLRDVIRNFVETGGSLYVPLATGSTVAALNEVFGWNLQMHASPTADVIPDSNKPDKKQKVVIPARPAQVRDLPYYLSDIQKSPKMTEIDGIALDAASLPPKAVELYTASVVQAFSTAVGEGRVSYVGFQGHGRSTTDALDQNVWKTILVRLMRGQRQLDL